MPNLAAEACRLEPVLTLDVVDDGAFAPCQECRNDEGHTLPLPCGCKGQYVFSTVVTQVMEVAVLLVVPAADINALRCVEKTCLSDVLLGGPMRGTVQVFCVLGERFSVAEIENKEDSAATKCSDHHEKSAKQ